MSDSEFPSMRRRIGLLLATLTLLVPLALSHANALNLFATHEVTAQFATHDGKPMVDAQVRVFAPGEAKTPVVTGKTDADGKFVFEADRDGFWSAEAHNADEVARVMIRVGGESQSQSQSRISPFYILGLLAILLAIAIWYRLLRTRTRRSRS
jgi:nickel transport protein